MADTAPTEHWYRYENGINVIYIRALPVIRTTLKGAWLNDNGTERFVLRVARKSFAKPTRKEAKESFIARKSRQIGILENQITNVKRVLAAVEGGKALEEEKENWFIQESGVRIVDMTVTQASDIGVLTNDW